MAESGATVGEGSDLGNFLRRAFTTGLTVSLPLLITLVVLIFVVNFIAGLLDPAVILIQSTIGDAQALPDLVLAGIALALLLVTILVVGIAAEWGYGKGLEDRVELAVAEVPGIGSIYSSVDDISSMLMDSDTESFREVRAIEYPFEETYALAFVTAGSTGVVGEATGEAHMITVFVPMAPNPMGGFLIHVPEDRTYEVDLSVEEGVEAILSTGVTLEAEAVAGADPDGEGDGVVDGDDGDGVDDGSDGEGVVDAETPAIAEKTGRSGQGEA
jgi:uncharacterized membrane protein